MHRHMAEARWERGEAANLAITSCCQPRSLAPLTVLYLVDGVPYQRSLPDMIATDCACIY